MSRHIPRKRFGQNFLQDPRTIEDIVDAVNPARDDLVVEIGPGLGAITRPLLARLNHLHVVEIDRDIIARLHRTFKAEQLTIHEGDALAFDFAALGTPLKIVGNLPYNISTPLLFHLASFGTQVTDMHFMLQKEVVERMVAEPKTNDYGRLSVVLQYYFEMEKILDVPPESFDPAPKVDSAVIRMIPNSGRIGVADDFKHLSRLLQHAFQQRRKTLRNNLKEWVSDEDFAEVGIAPTLRAEHVAPEQYVQLSNHLLRKSVAID